MTKAEIADVLEQIATLLELKDENPFKIRAYANAARAIDAWGGNVAELQDEEALKKMPGIGKAIAGKIKELATTGSSEISGRTARRISGRDSRIIFNPRSRREKDQGAL